MFRQSCIFLLVGWIVSLDEIPYVDPPAPIAHEDKAIPLPPPEPRPYGDPPVGILAFVGSASKLPGDWEVSLRRRRTKKLLPPDLAAEVIFILTAPHSYLDGDTGCWERRPSHFVELKRGGRVLNLELHLHCTHVTTPDGVVDGSFNQRTAARLEKLFQVSFGRW